MQLDIAELMKSEFMQVQVARFVAEKLVAELIDFGNAARARRFDSEQFAAAPLTAEFLARADFKPSSTSFFVAPELPKHIAENNPFGE